MLTPFEFFHRDDGDYDDALRELGRQFGTLREFRYFTSSEKIGAFDAIAQAAPLLEKVEIFVDGGGDDDWDWEDRVVDAARAFLVCPKVHQFRMQDVSHSPRRLEKIADMCTQRRVKKVPGSYVDVIFGEYLV